jgi:hypothetical protein
MNPQAHAAAPSSFLVEDFINSITVQLDKVQDALRLKAVNRPLTYALKDFSLDLHVFVDLDGNGNVRFRNSAPNETGASTVRLGFTTITKPMIEENTVSLAMTRSPSLDQLGLKPEERSRLEKLGVHNAAQLNNLYHSTSGNAVSRLAEMPIDRLRAALQLGRPQVASVAPAKSPDPDTIFTPAPDTSYQPPPQPRPVQPVIRIAPDTSHLHLQGSNLIGINGPARVRLENQPLEIAHAEDNRLAVRLPDPPRPGGLQVELPDGETLEYVLEVAAPEQHTAPTNGDRWTPRRGY